MSVRTIAVFIALALGAPTLGLARGYLEVEVAPPEPRYEAVPEARAGYVWVPGYWSWRHHDYAWVNGHYVHEHRGHHWVAATWTHEGKRYRFAAGHWDRD